MPPNNGYVSSAKQANKRNKANIQRLITLVNSVPPELELPSIESIVADDEPRVTVGAIMHKLSYDEQFTEFRRLTGGVDISLSYWLLRGARVLLSQIAALQSSSRRMICGTDEGVQIVEIGADGRLHFWDSLHYLFEGVEAGRVRQCDCGRFYWAKRLGKRAQTGCCTSHSARIKMRRLRRDHPEVYS